MDTMARVKELAAERNLSLHGLAKACDVPYEEVYAILIKAMYQAYVEKPILRAAEYGE